MTDIPLSKQIERQERKILGSEDWLSRARRGEIKRPAEAIQKAADDVSADKSILTSLNWLERNSEALRAFLASRSKGA